MIDALKDDEVIFVTQKEQKGTAHAIQQCNKELEGFDGNLLVLSGDVPLITKDTINSLISSHNQNGSKASMLTTIFKKKKCHQNNKTKHQPNQAKHPT